MRMPKPYCHYCKSRSDLATNYICKRCQSALRKKRSMRFLDKYDKEVLIK